MINQNKTGRTIIKWQPFASIPQQWRGISNIIDDQSKISLPVLDEDELERINYLLAESLEYNLEVFVDYWDNGRIDTKFGTIKKVDMIAKSVYLVDAYDTVYDLTLSSITNINFI